MFIRFCSVMRFRAFPFASIAVSISTWGPVCNPLPPQPQLSGQLGAEQHEHQLHLFPSNSAPLAPRPPLQLSGQLGAEHHEHQWSGQLGPTPKGANSGNGPSWGRPIAVAKCSRLKGPSTAWLEIHELFHYCTKCAPEKAATPPESAHKVVLWRILRWTDAW